MRVVLQLRRTSPFSLTFSSSCSPVSAQSPNFIPTDGFWQHSHCTVNTISPGAFSPYTVISVEIENDPRGHHSLAILNQDKGEDHCYRKPGCYLVSIYETTRRECCDKLWMVSAAPVIEAPLSSCPDSPPRWILSGESRAWRITADYSTNPQAI